MYCSSYAPPLLLSVSDSARALDRRKNCGDTLSRSSQLLNGESFKTSAYVIHNSPSRCVFVAVGCSVGWPECAPVCRCRRFSSSSEMPHASRKCCPSSPCGVLPNPAPLCVRFMHSTPIERYHARPHAIDAPLRSAPVWLHRCPTTARTAAPQWTPCWAGVLTVARCVPTASAAEAACFGCWLQVYGPAWRLHEGAAHALQEARPLSATPPAVRCSLRRALADRRALTHRDSDGNHSAPMRRAA